MKTLKSNNFDQALKAVEALDKGEAKKIKKEIPYNERKYFHLLLVKIENRPGQAHNKVIVNGTTINPQSFEKLEKNFRFLGYSQIIIVHDPRNNEPESNAPVLHLQDKLKIKEQAKKALEEKHKKELAEAEELLAKEKLEEKTGSAPEGDGGDEGSELDELTVDELKAFAESNSIDLSGLKKKEDIKTAIQTWLDENPEPPIQ